MDSTSHQVRCVLFAFLKQTFGHSHAGQTHESLDLERKMDGREILRKLYFKDASGLSSGLCQDHNANKKPFQHEQHYKAAGGLSELEPGLDSLWLALYQIP